MGVADLVLLVTDVEHLARRHRREQDVGPAARPADLQDHGVHRPARRGRGDDEGVAVERLNLVEGVGASRAVILVVVGESGGGGEGDPRRNHGGDQEALVHGCLSDWIR